MAKRKRSAMRKEKREAKRAAADAELLAERAGSASDDSDAPTTATNERELDSESEEDYSDAEDGRPRRKRQRKNKGKNEDPHAMSGKAYINKQRVLVFSSRGIPTRYRHLLQDLRALMPHSKKEAKMDRKDQLYVVNEVCELKSCNNCVFFEVRRKSDLYMWFAKTPHGPSLKTRVLNVHTMAELKMTGNCLKGSRPLLSFDAEFDREPYLVLIKELFTQIWGTPNRHPKSKPFIDHVFSFTVVDGKIWFRNYQIIEDQTGKKTFEDKLVEVGPRFVLEPIRVFEGSFCGATLWENPHYVTPNAARREIKAAKGAKYGIRKDAQQDRLDRKEYHRSIEIPDDLADVFTTTTR